MESVYIIDKETNIVYYLIGVNNISSIISTTLTQYPVPEGGYISDHAYNNPHDLSLQLISDGFNSTNKSYYIDTNNNKVQLTYENLKMLLNNWLTNAVQLDIQTKHQFMRNMVLTNLSCREDSSSWTKYSPTLTFKEIKIAHVYTTSIKALNVEYAADYSIENDISTGDTNGSEYTVQGIIGDLSAGAAVGGAIGGVVGSIIPGIGTGIGVFIGGGIGGAINSVVGFFRDINGG